MELKEFLDTIRGTIESIIQLVEQQRIKEAFHLYGQQVGIINGFIMFLDENTVVDKEDLQEMIGFLVQSLENEDAFLLKDVLQYALLDVINQLEGVSE